MFILSTDEQLYLENKWENFPNEQVCDIAAENGWLDLLKWARYYNYSWSSYTCSSAARNGHLYIFILNEVLKWAKINGCTWDSYTCSCSSF
jgi:hypothetical protein